MKRSDVKEITDAVAAHFLTFGGGRDTAPGNPLSAAFQHKPAMFALGVRVKAVVEFVLREAERKRKA